MHLTGYLSSISNLLELNGYPLYLSSILNLLELNGYPFYMYRILVFNAALDEASAMNFPVSFPVLHAVGADPPAARSAAHALNFGDAVWRADALAANTQAGSVLPTGHASLDAELPGGGWPVGALCEILQSHSAQSEWRLLLPALVAAQQGAKPIALPGQRSLVNAAATVVLIGPPHVPFGPALAAQGLVVHHLVWVKAQTPTERLWATEQALRCDAVAAVLAWLPQAQSASLRRLHMAAQDHAKLLFVMRPAQAQRESSPAPLRLMLLTAESSGKTDVRAPDALRLHLLKRRGPPMTQLLVVQSPSLAHHGPLDRFAA
jgi:protein ImuA